MRIILTLALLVVAPSLGHQMRCIQSASSEPRTKDDKVLIERIQAGDVPAIAEAGRSGNRLFVPYLRRELNDHKKQPDPAGPARVALARLGETDQLQDEWCRAVAGDPAEAEAAIRELGLVGGWFAVQGLQELLTPEGQAHFLSAPTKHKHDQDLMHLPPMYYALKILPDVVHNPPVEFPSQDWDRQTKIWQEWIAAHKEELSKLQPTGVGVDFSPTACKNGKPRKKH